jgi:hypothetical protein
VLYIGGSSLDIRIAIIVNRAVEFSPLPSSQPHVDVVTTFSNIFLLVLAATRFAHFLSRFFRSFAKAPLPGQVVNVRINTGGRPD